MIKNLKANPNLEARARVRVANQTRKVIEKITKEVKAQKKEVKCHREIVKEDFLSKVIQKELIIVLKKIMNKIKEEVQKVEILNQVEVKAKENNQNLREVDPVLQKIKIQTKMII